MRSPLLVLSLSLFIAANCLSVEGVPPLPPVPPPTLQEQKEIEELIANLALIDKPDFGISSTMSGEAFPPVVGAEHAGAMVLTDHKLERSRALEKLVALGPVAMPTLLKHLDDATKTKLEITHERMMGRMWYGNELWGNAVDDIEKKAIENFKVATDNKDGRKAFYLGESIRSHTVTVGDVCFAIVGMIGGRGYQAVRYQPTACIVINSTTHEPKLAKAVREIWAGENVRELLCQRLTAELQSPYGENSDSQPGAAMRLLYYFPEQAIPRVVERLRSVNENNDRVEVFIKAVIWHYNGRIREAIREIAVKSKDRDVLIACTPVMPEYGDDAYYKKLCRALNASKEEGNYPTHVGQGLLDAVARIYPKKSSEACWEYMLACGDEGAINVLQYCSENLAAAEVAQLSPLLANRNPGYGSYWITGKAPAEGEQKPERVRMRICDLAYWVIHHKLGHKEVQLKGSAEEMDARIVELLKSLQVN